MMTLRQLSAFLSVGYFMVACAPEFSQNGIVEAQESFELNPALERCAGNASCEAQSEALFWVAAIKLSDLSAVEIEVNWTQLSSDEKTNIIDAIQEPNRDPHQYDVQSDAFLEAYSQMRKAHDLGNAYASNELGVLHLENSALRDIVQAKRLFEIALERGDHTAQFNLARVYLEPEFRDEKRALKSLEGVAVHGKDFEYFHLRMKSQFFGSDSLPYKEQKFLLKKSNALVSEEWDQMFAPYFQNLE